MPNQNSGWFPDPSGEHQHRYYDGDNWTDMVGDNGIRSNSPLGRKVTIDRSLPRIQQIPYQHVTRNKDLAATPDYYAVAMTMLDNDNLRALVTFLWAA